MRSIMISVEVPSFYGNIPAGTVSAFVHKYCYI